MTQKFTREEVLEMASVLLHNPKPREWKTRAGNMLTAYADTLSKPADSGRAWSDAPIDEQIIAVCRAAGIRWIEPDEDDCGFPGGFDITYMTEMRNLFVALAAQEQGDAASPLVEFSVDFMDGWLEGESEEVIRNWKRVRQAATRPATAASPAGVPDDTRLLDALVRESWDLRCFDCAGGEDIGWRVVGHYMAAPNERTIAEVFTDDPRQAIEAALAAPSAPESDGGAE